MLLVLVLTKQGPCYFRKLPCDCAVNEPEKTCNICFETLPCRPSPLRTRRHPRHPARVPSPPPPAPRTVPRSAPAPPRPASAAVAPRPPLAAAGTPSPRPCPVAAGALPTRLPPLSRTAVLARSTQLETAWTRRTVSAMRAMCASAQSKPCLEFRPKSTATRRSLPRAAAPLPGLPLELRRRVWGLGDKARKHHATTSLQLYSSTVSIDRSSAPRQWFGGDAFPSRGLRWLWFLQGRPH